MEKYRKKNIRRNISFFEKNENNNEYKNQVFNDALNLIPNPLQQNNILSNMPNNVLNLSNYGCGFLCLKSSKLNSIIQI